MPGYYLVIITAKIASLPGRSNSQGLTSATTRRSGGYPLTRQEGVEILKLPFHRRKAPEFIEEVFQEHDVAPRLLRLRSLGRHQRHNAFAIGGEIDVPADNDRVHERLLGPQPGLARDEGVALHRVACH